MVVRLPFRRLAPYLAALLAACHGAGDSRGAASRDERPGLQPGRDAGAVGRFDASGLDAPDLPDGVRPDGALPDVDGGGGVLVQEGFGNGCRKLPAAEAVTRLDVLADPFFPVDSANQWTTGKAVAIDGDTLVVGAPRSSNTPSRGAVFVYARNAVGGWTVETRLEAPAGEPDTGFGETVALSGDTLVVGAPHEFFAQSGPNLGRVQVFRRGASGFAFETTLQAEVPADNDGFGTVLALSADTLAISTYRGGDGGVDVFERGAAGWMRVAVLDAVAPVESTGFGSSLALDGDTLAVGVVPGIGAAGQVVQLYERREGAWQPDVVLTPDRPGQFFAAALALSEDTLLVGDTYYEDLVAEPSLPTGAVYVFERGCDGAWTQGAFLRGSTQATGYAFGRALAIDGGRLVIGAPQDCGSASGIDGPFGVASDADSYSGAIYVFGRSAEGHVLLHYIKSNTTQLREKYFGESLAASGGEIVIGARGERRAYALH